MNKKISVIIPVRNEGEKIEKCLKAVFSQSLKPYEVLVIDGYSEDDSVKKAKKFPVKILKNKYIFRGGGCQVGLENAKGDYVAFINPDSYPSKNWLEVLYNNFDKEIVGVGSTIKDIKGDLWQNSLNLIFNTFLGSANSVQAREFPKKRFVDHISGNNSMYRRKDIIKVGGFINANAGEDLGLNKGLLKFGKFVYTPEAYVIHNHKKNPVTFSKKMFQYGYYRGLSKISGFQSIPTILAILLLISLFFTKYILLIAIALYFLMIFIPGIIFSIREKNFRYLFSIPVVYLIEHVCYSFGYFIGLISFKRIKPIRFEK